MQEHVCRALDLIHDLRHLGVSACRDSAGVEVGAVSILNSVLPVLFLHKLPTSKYIAAEYLSEKFTKRKIFFTFTHIRHF